MQVCGLLRNTGAARFVYDHMLGRVSAVKAQRAAEASYGVPEADLTPWQGWSLPDLRRTWNEIKQWVAPWWAECSKEAFNTGLANLSAALGNWHVSKSGARKGRRMGRPRFKRKRARRAARFTTGAIRVDAGIKHLAVLSTGELVDNPAPFKAALNKLGKAQRRAARKVGPYDPGTRQKRTASNRLSRRNPGDRPDQTREIGASARSKIADTSGDQSSAPCAGQCSDLRFRSAITLS